MSEILPTASRTVLNRSRASQARGPLAWLADRLVPSGALSWGRLTAVWPWVAVHGVDPMMVPPGVTVRCLNDFPACARHDHGPAFERLAATMGEAGKVTPDATSPAVFNPRLQR